MVFFGILIAIVVLCLCLVVHEYGHYYFMKRFGIEVKRFIIGFGPNIFSKKLKNGVIFQINLIFLGAGVEPTQKGEYDLRNLSFLKQFFVYVSGMLFNVLFGCVLIFGLNLWNTLHQPLFYNMAFGVQLLLILKLIGWALLISFVIWLLSIPLIIYLLCGGDLSFLGIAASSDAGSIVGPVGIIYMMFGMKNIIEYLQIVAAINLGLASMNLLPIMPLDGGRIFLLAIVKIFKITKEKAVKYEERFSIAGFLVIMLIFLYATFSDISRIIG